MATLIQFRRGTAAQWTSANPTLHAGELGFETDTEKFKIGNGSTVWTELTYGNDLPSEVNALIAAHAELTSTHGVTGNIVGTTDSQTLTTKTISGSNNTITNIGNSSLTNHSITINSSQIALGASHVFYTDDISEGSTNKYFTSQRARDAVASDIATAIAGVTISSTDAVPEGVDNLYFTNQRALNATTSAYDHTGAASTAQSNAATYTDGKISTEVTNRNSAIATAKGEAITTSEGYTDSAISTEVTNRNSAINTAKGQAISTSEGYTDTAISNEVNDRNTAIATAKSEAEGYTDTKISQEVTNRNSAIATAKSQAITTAESYTDTAITNLVNGAPAVLDTLKELADAIADDANFATTVTTHIATAKSDAESYTDGKISTEVTNRNNAIATSLSTAEGYTDSAISTEVTNRNNAIGSALTTAEGYTDSAISTEVTNRNSAISTHSGLTTGTHGVTGTIVGTTDTQTLTHKTISGASNTLSNIANASLTNSKVTINTHDLSLGGSLTLGTDDIAEGTTNLYYTDTRAKDAAVSAITAGTGVTKTTGSHSASFAIGQAVGTTSNVTFNTVTADLTGNVTGTVSSLSNHTTSDLSEGTNLYFTNERAQDAVFNAVTNGTGISTSYDDAGNSFSITNTGVTSLTGTSNQITASASTGGVTLSLPSSVVLPGNLEVSGDTVIDGNLQVKGTTTTVNTQTLSVQDNLIYLNQPLSVTITGATHNTTTVEYKVSDNSQIVTGMAVRVTGVTPSNYNISSGDNVTVVSKRTQGNNNYFTVTKTVAVAYTSGGTAEFKTSVNPDLGFAGGYYDGTYHHAGLFRDVTDSGIWKFFQGYVPEPDASVNIDTTDASFALAPIAASAVTATTFTGALTGNVTGNVSGNAGTVTNGVYTTDTGTVTNTMLAGSISNAKLVNSKVTLGSTDVSLGATATTLAGLSSVTSTTFVGALTGNASTATKLQTARNINGVAFDGSADITITSTNPNALTIGTGLSGTSYNGSSAVTIANTGVLSVNGSNGAITNVALTTGTLGQFASTTSLQLAGIMSDETGSGALVFGTSPTLTTPRIASIVNTGTLTLPTSDDTLVGRATTDTLTNKSISGSSNTLTSIPNSALVNNSVTLGSTPVALGATATTLSGLSSVSSTSFVGALTGNASTATALQTARTINGTSFDGSSNITVTAAAGTLTGSTLNSGVTASSLTSVGTLTSLTTSGDATIGGNATITGTLTVNGTTTTVNSTTLTVTDKNIEIGNVASPTDTTANGGGITLHGTTDKTLNWVSATPAWTSSENFDLASGKTYKINGTTVLSASQVLGKTIGGTSSGDIADISTAQTLTNKTISGSANTLTNIGNSSLTNSKVTIGTTDISLGNSATTISGLSSLSSTSFTGALTGNASTATKLAATKNINGVAFDGSSDITVKATATNALTIGTGLSGTSYDGSAAVTVAIDSTVATLTGSQTLTNKTLTSPTIGTILNTGTLTLPTSTDTLVGKATTDTFTNKTFDTAGTGNSFKINGTSISAVTGSGSAVLATSPTLVTPTIGVATATSVNKVAITAPASSATLTLADGSTLATSGAYTTTLTATGATSLTLPTSGTLISSAAFTAKGNVLVGTGSGTYTNFGVGTDGYALIADSTQTAGVKWGQVASDPLPQVLMLGGM
jgi:Major tropism determinant N-terminal domain